jgi:2-polyprenyl-3-methyl-5-hydroxy-6-metoxy-1,4-benzoquinol methylase
MSSPQTPLERAIYPGQYDLTATTTWAGEARVGSARSEYFWHYLQPHVARWEEKAVLDIGAGTGWLVFEALKAGAELAVGIEPADTFIAQSQQDHPNIALEQVTLEEFDSKGQTFDIVVALMSFTHIEDPTGAFRKIGQSLLNPGGQVMIVVPDYDYYKTPRNNYPMELQELSAEEYAISITRPTGIIADIVRTTAAYQRYAAEADLKLVAEEELPPTEKQLTDSYERYKAVVGKPLTRLLIFEIDQKTE